MVAVITGDIISSRKIVNQEKWLSPLKDLLESWGETPKDWILNRGDFFQVEVKDIHEALNKALQIKALIKSVEPNDEGRRISTIDVRLAIGIGEKTYSGISVSESNGPAFINSGEKFDTLKKENIRIGVKTPWNDFDEEMNLYLKLASTFMDKWYISSAELMLIALKNPGITQEEIGKKLDITQGGISKRWNRAYVSETLKVERMFRKKIKIKLYDHTY